MGPLDHSWQSQSPSRSKVWQPSLNMPLVTTCVSLELKSWIWTRPSSNHRSPLTMDPATITAEDRLREDAHVVSGERRSLTALDVHVVGITGLVGIDEIGGIRRPVDVVLEGPMSSVRRRGSPRPSPRLTKMIRPARPENRRSLPSGLQPARRNPMYSDVPRAAVLGRQCPDVPTCLDRHTLT